MKTEQIIQLADTCVKCGLCLPRCPTYQKTAQEADSPRGRIALVQGFLTGFIPDTKRLAESIDRCLECHACETACPAHTKVTQIIDAVRAVRMEKQSIFIRWIRNQLLNLAIRPAWFMPLIRIYQTSWLKNWVSKYKLLKFLKLDHVHDLLPDQPLIAAKTGTFNTVVTKPETIAVFTGCLGRFTDAPAIDATVTILMRLGFQVTVLSQPCCCGALHRHDGFDKRAEWELANTVQIFKQYDKVLTVASACLESLRLHPELAVKTEDATRFIAALAWPDTLLPIDAPPYTVWVHVPCSQRRTGGVPEAAINLLQRIPGIAVMALPNNDVCCGAAGTYMLRQPVLSQALLADKLQVIQANAVQILVTTNTGCALKFKAGLRGVGIRVCHPLEILASRY